MATFPTSLARLGNVALKGLYKRTVDLVTRLGELFVVPWG